MTCFENIVRIRRLIYPNFFFAGRVVEMIVLPQRIVWLVEAMYQSAFLSLEFRLNSELTSSVARHIFNMRKRFPHNQCAGLMQQVAVESLTREQSKSVLLLFCFIILITTKCDKWY